MAAAVTPEPIPRQDFWQANGPVHAVAVTNGVIYIGGAFDYVGPPGRKIAGYDLYTAAPDGRWPSIAGSSVHAIIPDDAGGWYIGGSFNEVGGQPRGNLAHVFATGQLDPDFQPNPDGVVKTLALGDDTLFVGGEFSRISGANRGGLAALDLTNRLTLRWANGVNGGVSNLLVAGDTVYVGGLFTQAGGATRTNLAALEVDSGVARPWLTQIDGAVLSLAWGGDRLFVGGLFNRIGGQLRNGLAALDVVSGVAITNWNPNPIGDGPGGAGGKVTVLRALCDTVYVGGSFTNLGGAPRVRAGAVDAVTGTATSWNPPLSRQASSNISSTVLTLELEGNTIYLGGNFVTTDPAAQRDLIVVDAINGAPLAWAPGADGTVNAIGVTGRSVLAGFVAGPGGVARRNLAALDGITGRVLDWDPGVNNEVRSLIVWSNLVVAGGQFTEVHGQPRDRIAAIDANSGQPVWNTGGADAVVHALAVLGDRLYVGGEFNQVDGLRRPRIAAIALPGGGLVLNWSNNFDGPIRALLPRDNDALYVGGDFTTVAGAVAAETRHGLAALDLTTAGLKSWDPDLPSGSEVRALTAAGNTIYAGGFFARVGQLARTNLAALDAGTGLAIPWNPGADAEVDALCLGDGVVFVGGAFSTVANSTRLGLAAVDFNGLLLDWNPGREAGNAVEALAAGDSLLLAGGRTLQLAGPAGSMSLGAFPRIGSPRITQAPRDLSVIAGQSVIFQAIVAGTPPLFLQWRKDGVAIPGANSELLAVQSASLGDAGRYTLVATNAAGAVAAEAVLSVQQPVRILAGPLDQTVTAGTTLTLGVTAIGVPSPLYQWRRNGINIPGAVFSTLTFPNAQPADGGSYEVVVFNGAGAAVSAPATAIVTSPALPFADLFQDAGNLNGSSGVGSGDNRVAGVEPEEPRHVGKVGGRSVWLRWVAPAGGFATFNTRGSTFDTLLAIYTGTNLTNLVRIAGDEDLGGFYTSEATFNAVAGVDYRIAVDGFAGASGHIVLSWNLEVSSVDGPRIISQPRSQSVGAGQTASFRVTAAGPATLPLLYQWYFGCRTIPGATNDVLSIPNVRRRNVGSYHVLVQSGTHTVESAEAALEIGAVPDIVSRDKLEDLLFPPEPFQPAAAAVPPGFLSVSLGVLGGQGIDTRGAGATESLLCSGVPASASKWIGLHPTLPATLLIDTVGSHLDTVLAVYDFTNVFAPRAGLVLCDTNSGPDGASLVKFDARGGANYLVVVGGVNRAEGLIPLNWKLGLPPGIVAASAPRLRIPAGGSNTLWVTLTNDFDATYRWFRNGQMIAAATNQSFVLSDVGPGAAGQYTMVASNFAGLVTNTF
ncbi:MAG TPA: immunoglobulin domain-containing protein, partial [Candidatus Dormibacteraeota bacterium]|nr:immunoglobulin domain-containing protein [Candidatus Dormibacteraeota bacterium]